MAVSSTNQSCAIRKAAFIFPESAADLQFQWDGGVVSLMGRGEKTACRHSLQQLAPFYELTELALGARNAQHHLNLPHRDVGKIGA